MCIRDIAGHLPGTVVTNEELAAENPDWNIRRVESVSGIVERRIARQDETALDLAQKACETLFHRHPGLPQMLDGLIFCTQSPDYLIPGNSNVLHGILGLSERVLAFDLNLACSGYVYALMLADGLFATHRVTHLLLVTADTYSKYIHPRDRSVRALFGDGAAVTWLAGSGSGAGLVDVLCGTQGRGYDKFIIPAGGCRRRAGLTGPEMTTGDSPPPTAIHMDGTAMLEFILAQVPAQIRFLLARNHLSLDEIDLMVFHQASRLVLDSLAGALGVPSHRVVNILRSGGNTVSASIPLALEKAMKERMIQPGTRVLLSGFGAGLSWGTALIEF